VFALAGIAGPARFTRRVTDAGYVVAGAWAPGDHYRYTRVDLARLAREVRAADAVAVLTTSKDAARLRALRPLPVVVYEWPMRVTIEATHGTAGAPAVPFATWLRGRLAASRGESGDNHRVSA
jgi:tetraacyldisaccharide-1-P 4'-kinase